MKFSQELVDDTILPKMDLYDMSMKNKMGKSAKTDSLPISDSLVMYLYDVADGDKRYVRVDFKDYSTYNRSFILMNRTKLREVADFILKYLENN